MKQLILIFLVTSYCILSSCSTRIPSRDSKRPTFTFIINGPGLSQQLNQDFDYDNNVLYLKRGDTYTISYIGGDSGGLQSMLWEIQKPEPIIAFPEGFPAEWNSSLTVGNFHQITWLGDRSNPLTGYALNTELIPYGISSDRIEEIETLFALLDYHENEERKPLTIRIHNEAPRLGAR